MAGRGSFATPVPSSASDKGWFTRVWAGTRLTAGLFQKAAYAWVEDRAPRLGAALSYYTVFSLAPILLIAIAVAGFVVGGDTAREAVLNTMGGLIGEDGGKAIEGMIDNAAKNRGSGLTATGIGTVMLLIGASGVFVELQGALNTAWGVESTSSGVRGFVRDRLASFGMVLGIGFLLLVSLLVTAALSATGDWVQSMLPGSAFVWQFTNMLVSFAITAGLFAMIFKFVPDVEITWQDVAVGAVVTALLFSLGKLAIGFYLGRSTTASIFGAAGSLAVLLVWVYYSSLILLYGAEFTQAWANTCGSHLNAEADAQLKRGAKPTGKRLDSKPRQTARPLRTQPRPRNDAPIDAG